MTTELETQLQEAFAARAATTTVSDDAWARVNRRVDRHDHRRTVVLRSVAAAVIAVLIVGGGVTLWSDNRSNTVATGGRSSKSMAEDGASASGTVAPAAPFVPAGDGLEVQQNADGTIVVRFGSTTTAPVQPGGISAAIVGDTVFGVAPASAGSITVEVPSTDRWNRMLMASLAPANTPYRTFRFAGISSDTARVTAGPDNITTVARRGGNG